MMPRVAAKAREGVEKVEEDKKSERPLELPDNALAASTSTKYARALLKFDRWLADNEKKVDEVDPDQMDDNLRQYFRFLYRERSGKGKGLAEATLNAVHKRSPRMRGRLPLASDSLKAFQKVQQRISHPPMTLQASVAVGLDLAEHGFLFEGIAVVLSFDCLLRIGEMRRLRSEDVIVGDDPSLGLPPGVVGHPVLVLPRTKTGADQSVEILYEQVGEMVVALKRCTPEGGLLFPFSEQSYRLHFHEACARLGLSERFVPHSLRHGGATLLARLHWPLADIMDRGRWAEAKSARGYIQRGRGLQLQMRIPDAVFARGEEAFANLARAFALTQEHSKVGGGRTLSAARAGQSSAASL
jgi:integrase